MNKFEKQLEKWNNGILRGAQAKLAKTLKVSTATTALWATGKRRPSKGYVAQMARLFNLDIYQVVKLFETSFSYPTPETPLQALHEQRASYPYQALDNKQVKSNSVLLPFLAHIPLDYPHYPEEDILECWSIPRRYAQGAKYIVRSSELGLPNATTGSDLCFIKPCHESSDGQATLLTDGKQVVVWRAESHKGKLAYKNLSNTQLKTDPTWKVLGVIISRIHPF